MLGGAHSSGMGFASGHADGDQQSAFKSTSMTLEDSVSAFSHADVQVALSSALEASVWLESKHTELTYMLSQNSESDSDLRSLLESYDPQKQRALASSASTGGSRRSLSISEEKATIQPQLEYSATELKEMDRKLVSWGFDVLSEPPDALLGYALRIYDQFEVISKFNLKSDTVAAFLTEIKNSYLPNPYHNWHHGFSVLHASSLMLRSGVMQLLKLTDVLALLIAAIGHDVGHPGTNNDFQVHSSSHFAISYNDHSVLENFHASATFRILQLPHCNLLKDMSLQTHAGIRETIIKAILSTDISVHFKMVASLKQKYLDAAQKVAAGAAEAAHQVSAAGTGAQLRTSGPTFTSFKNRRSTLMLNMNLRPVNMTGSSSGDKQKQAQGQPGGHPGGDRGQSIGLGPSHTGSSVKLNPNSSFQRKYAVRRRSSIELKSEGKEERAGAGWDMDLDADQVFSIEERSDRIALVEAVIHSADLANSVLRFDLYRKWTHLVVQEFYDQSLAEKKLGLPTLPHMCNPPDDDKALANLQLHFIDYVVAPLWAIMRDLFPDLSPRYDQLELNRMEWRRIQKELELLKDASAQAESKARDSVIDDDDDTHSAERNP
jgi:hypothetical protein